MSLGIASIILATLVQSIALGVVLLPCAYLIGRISDWDMRLPVKHRGKASHSATGIFAILILIAGVALFYLLALLDTAVPLFGASAPAGVPAFFPKLLAGDAIGAVTDPIFTILLTFYTAFLMHLVLDTVTRAGIAWGGRKVKGDYRSSDARINRGFVLFGGVTTAISLPAFALRALTPIAIYPYYAYFCVTFIIALVLIVLRSVQLRNRREDNRCFLVAGREVCLRRKCIAVDGRVLCPSD